MDVGTGSGILAAWAAQAGARKVYASKYCALGSTMPMRLDLEDHSSYPFPLLQSNILTWQTMQRGL